VIPRRLKTKINGGILKYINVEQVIGKITYSSPPNEEERAINQKSGRLNNDSMTGLRLRLQKEK
jgi:hypothetical protein